MRNENSSSTQPGPEAVTETFVQWSVTNFINNSKVVFNLATE